MKSKVSCGALALFLLLFVPDFAPAEPPLESYRCSCGALPLGTVYKKKIGLLGSEHTVVELGVRADTDFCRYPYPACSERSCEVEVWVLEQDRTILERRPCDVSVVIDDSDVNVSDALLSFPSQ